LRPGVDGSNALLCLIAGVIRRDGQTPKYIVCDRDSIFDCDAFRDWVERQGICPPRYGAVGQHGSIADVEQLILTIKTAVAMISWNCD
jgi:hypothetical protein